MKKQGKKKENKAITSALAQLEKRFGGKVVQKMGESDASDIETISTGRNGLNEIMGGGFAVGKVHEIFAESGTGKTGLALEVASQVQSNGGTVAFIDSEHALNTDYCELIGVNVDELYISQPDYGEQAFEAIRVLINTGEIDLIIVDSVAGLTPLAELEGEIGEQKIALQARLMSKGLKLITGPANVNKCTVIFLNQLRNRIALYGPSDITSGGKALKFYCCQRLELKSKGMIREGSDVVGFKQHIKVVKNKVSAPFKEIEYTMRYGTGIDTLGDVMEGLIFEEIIEKQHNSYSYKGTKLAVGIKKLRTVLEDNPDMLEEMKNELKAAKK